MAGFHTSPVLSKGQSWCSCGLAKLSGMVSLHPGLDSKPPPVPSPFLSPPTGPPCGGWWGPWYTLSRDCLWWIILAHNKGVWHEQHFFWLLCCKGIMSQIHVFKYSLELAVSHPGLFNPIHYQGSISPTWFTGVPGTLVCCSCFSTLGDQHLLWASSMVRWEARLTSNPLISYQSQERWKVRKGALADAGHGKVGGWVGRQRGWVEGRHRIMVLINLIYYWVTNVRAVRKLKDFLSCPCVRQMEKWGPWQRNVPKIPQWLGIRLGPQRVDPLCWGSALGRWHRFHSPWSQNRTLDEGPGETEERLQGRKTFLMIWIVSSGPSGWRGHRVTVSHHQTHGKMQAGPYCGNVPTVRGACLLSWPCFSLWEWNQVVFLTILGFLCLT